MDTLTMQSISKETVRELISLLIRHPDLRREIKEALFPDLDLEQAFQELTTRVNELAEAQKRTEVSIQQLSSRVLDLEIAQRRTEATLQQLLETQQELLKRVANLEIRMENVENRLEKVENRLENVENRLENVENRLENVENRLEKVENRLDRLEEKVDTGFAKLTSLIGQLGSRWGIYNESIWRQTIATLIEKVYGDRVEECHIEGEQFDVVISNGKHILLEITARFKSNDFRKIERKRELYTTHVQAPARFIIAAASIHSRQARQLQEAGYELIEPEEDI